MIITWIISGPQAFSRLFRQVLNKFKTLMALTDVNSIINVVSAVVCFILEDRGCVWSLYCCVIFSGLF